MMKNLITVLLLLAVAESDIRNFKSDKSDCTNLDDIFVTKDISKKIPNDVVKCSSNQTISVLAHYCISYSNTHLVEVGKCIYNSLPDSHPYKELPVCGAKFNEALCKEFNREGTLCGNCRDGYYPLANSFNLTCVECPNGRTNWWKFVLVPFLPLTVLYFLVFLFKINVASSQFHGFFMYSQAVAIPTIVRTILLVYDVKQNLHIQLIFKTLSTLYGICNLDFFRALDIQICLKTNMLQTLALDVLVGTYCIFLLIVSYLLISLYDQNFRPLIILWKPFGAFFGLFRQNWDTRTSLIDAFTTFFILSFMKFLNVSFDLLAPVQLYKLDSSGSLNVSWRLFYNASVPYFGEKHLPYGILGAAVLLFFVLLPTILFTVYPFAWFQKLLNLFPFRRYILHTFMDSLHGCYKDGTQPGIRDYRWFACTFLIIRFILMLIGMFTLTTMFYPLCIIALLIFVIILINLDPFKENKSTVTNSVFLLLLGLTYTLGALRLHDKLLYWCLGIAVHLPLLYISALTLHWIYSHKKFGSEFLQRFSRRRHGYLKL